VKHQNKKFLKGEIMNCRILKNRNCNITNLTHSKPAVDIIGSPIKLDDVISHSAGKVVWLQTGQKNNQGSTGNASYGNCIKIKHNNGYFTLYAHLNKVNVYLGQILNEGQIIGSIGNTGNSYGPHLHFEVRNTSDTRINPVPYLDAPLPGDEPITEEWLIVTWNKLNVFTRNTIYSKKIGSLKKYDKVKIDYFENGWYHIWFSTNGGWVSAKGVRKL